jgi:hypothetical protein
MTPPVAVIPLPPPYRPLPALCCENSLNIACITPVVRGAIYDYTTAFLKSVAANPTTVKLVFPMLVFPS